MPPGKGEIRFSRINRKYLWNKNLRLSGNQFTAQLRILIKKPCLFRGVTLDARRGESGKKGMRYLLTTIGFVFLFAAPAFAREESLLARITVYWPGEGQLRACSNGARLRAGHCAVDPKRIPFGSRVFFPDAACVAVDSGPAVVSRKAARVTGRTVSQRNAIVIDRFFESKEAALSWEGRHPHFMTVRVVSPGSRDESKEAIAETSKKDTPIAELREINKLAPQADANGSALSRPNDSLMRAGRRRAL
jgi:3D (Asp-Asp-Asp) domain-containing protein